MFMRCPGRPDLCLLDDPLAALDAHVGRQVFRSVVGPGGLLSSATRILVTHSLAVLPACSRILVIRDGTVAEQGTFHQLSQSAGPFAEFLAQHAGAGEEAGVGEEGGGVAAAGPGESGSGEESSQQVRRRRTSDQKPDGNPGKKTPPLHRLQTLISKRHKIRLAILCKSLSHIWCPGPEDAARLTEDEEAMTGRVSWSVYTKAPVCNIDM